MKCEDVYGEDGSRHRQTRTSITVTRVCLGSQMWALLYVTFVSLLSVNAAHSRGKPAVDPGLFMITGVQTCREGSGYCLMGLDCTLDNDFLPDDTNGHCNGLKSAFTPSAHFTCCKYNTERDQITTTRRPRPGVLKPTTSTPSPTTTTEETTTTSEPPDTTTETITSTQSEPVDIFIDINNEVIKEIVPPALDKEQQKTDIISSELLEFLKSDDE